MKPDWKDAPNWANWLAMDKDGEWWWFENEPELRESWWEPGCGHLRKADMDYYSWTGTLEYRS